MKRSELEAVLKSLAEVTRKGYTPSSCVMLRVWDDCSSAVYAGETASWDEKHSVSFEGAEDLIRFLENQGVEIEK